MAQVILTSASQSVTNYYENGCNNKNVWQRRQVMDFSPGNIKYIKRLLLPNWYVIKKTVFFKKQNKHGCSCFVHTILILWHFLFMFFTLPCFGPFCSYCQKVSSYRDQILLLSLRVYMDALWLTFPGHNVLLTHNDMLFLWLCWFTVRVIQL